MIKYALTMWAVLVLTVPAMGQKHSHGSIGPNGGLMDDVAGVHAELMTSGNTVTVNIFNEDNKPIKTAGYVASALVVNGPDRETIKLEPTGDNMLKGEVKKAIARNTQITVMIKTAEGKSGQVRFKIEK
jgi:hypothetical protein